MKIDPCFVLKKEKIFLGEDQKWKHRIAALLSILDVYTISEQSSFFNIHQDQIFVLLQEWWSLIKIKISKSRVKFISKYESSGSLGLLSIKEGIEWSRYTLLLSKCIFMYNGSFSSLEYEQFLLNWIQSLLSTQYTDIHPKFQCEALQLLLLWIRHVPDHRYDHPVRQVLIHWLRSLLVSLNNPPSKQESFTMFSGPQLSRPVIVQRSIQDLLYLVTYGCFLPIESISAVVSDFITYFVIPFELEPNDINMDIHNTIMSYLALWMSCSKRQAIKPIECIWIRKCSLSDHQSKNILLFSDPSHPLNSQLFVSQPIKGPILIQMINEKLGNLFGHMILNGLDSHNHTMLDILLRMIYDHYLVNSTISSLPIVLERLKKILKYLVSNPTSDDLSIFESIFEFLLLIGHKHDEIITFVWDILIDIETLLPKDVETSASSLLLVKYYSKTLFTIYVSGAQHNIGKTIILPHQIFIQEWIHACESLTCSVFNIESHINHEHHKDYLHDIHYIWEYDNTSSIFAWKKLVNMIDNLNWYSGMIVRCYENISNLLFGIKNQEALYFMFDNIWLRVLPLLSCVNDETSVEISCNMIKKWIEAFNPVNYVENEKLFISSFYKKLLISLNDSSSSSHILRLFSFLFEIAYPDIELCICCLVDNMNDSNWSLWINVTSFLFSFRNMEIPSFTLTKNVKSSSFVVTPVTHEIILDKTWTKVKNASKDNCFFLFYWIIQMISEGDEYRALINDSLEKISSLSLACVDPLSYTYEDGFKSRCAIQIYSTLALLADALPYKKVILDHLLKALRMYYTLIDSHQYSFKKIHRQKRYQLVCLTLIHQILWAIQEWDHTDDTVEKEMNHCYKITLKLYDQIWSKLVKRNRIKQAWITCLSMDSMNDETSISFGTSSFDDVTNRKSDIENLEMQLEQLLLQIMYQCSSILSNTKHFCSDVDIDTDIDPCVAVYIGQDKIMTLKQLSDRALITIRYPSGKSILTSNNNTNEKSNQKMKNILIELVSKLRIHTGHLKHSWNSLSESTTMDHDLSTTLLPEYYDPSNMGTGFLVLSDGLKRDLVNFDRKSVHEHIKAAIIFKGKHDNEREILINNVSDSSYQKFLDLLSIKYEQRKEGYRYYENSNTCIIFHDSTQIGRSLPPEDRYLKRKQHVGNDHIHVVFIEKEDRLIWDPNMIKCDFGTMIILVRPIMKHLYSVRITYKESKINWMTLWIDENVILLHESVVGCFIRALIVVSYRSIMEDISQMPYRHPYYDRMIYISEMIKKHSQVSASSQSDILRDTFYERLMSSITELERNSMSRELQQ